jgi:hypothetical protein
MQGNGHLFSVRAMYELLNISSEKHLNIIIYKQRFAAGGFHSLVKKCTAVTGI